MSDLIRRAKEIVSGRTPGPWSIDSVGDKHRLIYDLKAQHPKHWDQDDEAFRTGGWKPLNICDGDNTRFIALMGSVADEMLAVIEAAIQVKANFMAVNDGFYTGLVPPEFVPLLDPLKALDTALAKHLGIEPKHEFYIDPCTSGSRFKM
jgi:hypothetical protein